MLVQKIVTCAFLLTTWNRAAAERIESFDTRLLD